MTLLFAFLLAALTFLPFLLFAVLLLRALAPLHRALVLLLALAAAVFLFARPHHEIFTGLDNSAYRLAAEAFAAGRPLRAPDAVLATVPPDDRAAFLYTGGREPTRDTVFRLAGLSDPARPPATRPWFLPTPSLLGMAAVRLHLPVTAPSALLGALLACILMAAAARIGRLPGLLLAAGLLLATPLPAFFFRGFYAEAFGTALVAAAIAYALAARHAPDALPPLRLLVTFLLVFPLAFHRSAALLGVLCLLALFATDRGPRSIRDTFLGALLGALPALWTILFVTQPYGHNLLGRTHPFLAVLAPAALLGALALALGLRIPAVQNRLAAHARAIAILLAAALLALLLPPLCTPLANPLHQGFLRTADAIPLSAAIILAPLLLTAPVTAILRPSRNRLLLLALLCCAALSALAAWHLLGREIPAGPWSYRRLLPPLLPLCALLPFAFADALSADRPRPARKLAAALLLAAPLCLGPVLHPYSYAARIHPDAPALADALATQARATERPVLFDYFSHAIPLAVHLQNRVLAIRPWAYERYWPAAWNWLRAQAAAQPPDAPPAALATTYAPVAYESGAFLSEEPRPTPDPPPSALSAPAGNQLLDLRPATGRIPVRFLAIRPLTTLDDLAALAPLAPPGRLLPPQEKIFDGGPAALRGPWGPAIHRRSGQWTRQGSALLAPVPPPGHAAILRLRASCYPPATQALLRVTAPWGATADLRCTAPDARLTCTFPPPSDPAALPPVAPYVFTSPAPYDPGPPYPSDLGLFLHSATLSIVPAP